MKRLLIFATVIFFALLPGMAVNADEKSENKNAPALKDGVYIGKAKGYADDIVVKVEISSGKIKNVQIVEHHDDSPGESLEKIPRAIVKKGSPDKIDAVTGATFTSNGIIDAVKDALKKASSKIPDKQK